MSKISTPEKAQELCEAIWKRMANETPQNDETPMGMKMRISKEVCGDVVMFACPFCEFYRTDANRYSLCTNCDKCPISIQYSGERGACEIRTDYGRWKHSSDLRMYSTYSAQAFYDYVCSLRK